MNWPIGQPRTPPDRRSSKRPYQDSPWGPLHAAVEAALDRIRRYSDRETRLLEVSTGHDPRHIGASGRPLANATAPQDPGVVVWFTLDGQTHGVPCDGYQDPRQNARSVINYLHQMARSLRDGVGTVDAMFQGFLALPATSTVTPAAAGEPLAVQEYRRRIAQGQDPSKARRVCAVFAHPDHGGSDDDMAALNAVHAQITGGRS